MEANPFRPYKVTLEKGETYYWCTCGLSKKQPFCDGSHKDTDMKPLVFTHETETENAFLCGCKQNKRAESGAYCDGSHKNLSW